LITFTKLSKNYQCSILPHVKREINNINQQNSGTKQNTGMIDKRISRYTYHSTTYAIKLI